MWKRLIGCGVIMLALNLTGCSSALRKSGSGAVLGGIAGAIIGHQSGERDKGIIAGTLAGATLGYMVGNEEDKAGGHWEQRTRRAWVEGYDEQVFVPSRYEQRCDVNGRAYNVLMAEGHYVNKHHAGYWKTDNYKKWVAD